MSDRETMRAAVLHEIRDLRVEDIKIPELKNDEVMIKIRANGICGSDIHFYEKGELGPFKVEEPYVPGHESSGEVIETGESVESLKEGDKVVVEPGLPCRKCEYCKTGRYNLCPEVTFLSAPPVNGTLSEYVSVPADFVYKIPENMSYLEGALVEPTMVGVHACNRGEITAGMSAVVLGVGPIGLLTLQAVRAYGVTEVIAVDIIPERLELADTGEVANLEKENIENKMQMITNDKGVDVAFETAGNTETSRSSVNLVKRGGTVVHVGWTDPGEFPYSIETVMEKELDIKGVNRYANAYPTAIALIAEGKIRVKPLITHTFDLEEAKKAFAYALNNRQAVIKAVVES
ncbi:MAG: NAD(P)-dependent alcohol dehydrogenase [Bacillota bacterium]